MVLLSGCSLQGLPRTSCFSLGNVWLLFLAVKQPRSLRDRARMCLRLSCDCSLRALSPDLFLGLSTEVKVVSIAQRHQQLLETCWCLTTHFSHSSKSSCLLQEEQDDELHLCLGCLSGGTEEHHAGWLLFHDPVGAEELSIHYQQLADPLPNVALFMSFFVAWDGVTGGNQKTGGPKLSQDIFVMQKYTQNWLVIKFRFWLDIP